MPTYNVRKCKGGDIGASCMHAPNTGRTTNAPVDLRAIGNFLDDLRGHVVQGAAEGAGRAVAKVFAHAKVGNLRG